MTDLVDLQAQLNFWQAQLSSEQGRTAANQTNFNTQLNAANAESPVNSLLVTYLTAAITAEQARTAYRQDQFNTQISAVNAEISAASGS